MVAAFWIGVALLFGGVWSNLHWYSPVGKVHWASHAGVLAAFVGLSMVVTGLLFSTIFILARM